MKKQLICPIFSFLGEDGVLLRCCGKSCYSFLWWASAQDVRHLEDALHQPTMPPYHCYQVYFGWTVRWDWGIKKRGCPCGQPLLE